VFTYLPRRPCERICTKCGIGHRILDIITCAKFYIDRFRSFDSVGVKICHSPITKLVAINTVQPLPRCLWYWKLFCCCYQLHFLLTLCNKVVVGSVFCLCSAYKSASATELYLKEHDHLLRYYSNYMMHTGEVLILEMFLQCVVNSIYLDEAA